MTAPSLEVLKTGLDGALSNLVYRRLSLPPCKTNEELSFGALFKDAINTSRMCSSKKDAE